MELKRSFFTSAFINTATAGINMLVTVLVVRFFGPGIYANFIVDLSYVSLLAIFFEIVPTNYILFRVQDDPLRYRGLAALAIASSLLMSCITFIAYFYLGLFQSNSLWIVPYASSLGIKRYIDARLQSSGRLTEFFLIELRGSSLRVAFLLTFFFLSMTPVVAVWASIASATLLTQILWFINNKDEREIFNYVFCRSSWNQLIGDRRSYYQYYLGITLKRLNNNLVTILANVFFQNKDILGSFFLAYRGLLFTVGQLRVIEGLLNHRKTLATIEEFSNNNKIIVAAFGQLICIIVSIALEYASSLKDINYLTIIILSFSVWLSLFAMIERAKAYSEYNIFSVNISMLIYLAIYSSLVFMFIFLNIRDVVMFSIILVLSDAAYFVTILYISNTKTPRRQSKITI